MTGLAAMGVKSVDIAAGRRSQRGRGPLGAGSRAAGMLGWLALAAAGAASAGDPAAGDPAAGEPVAALSVRLSAADAEPWQALDTAERRAIAAAVGAQFGRALGVPVTARFCPSAGCSGMTRDRPALSMALAGLREGTPSGGFSITFSDGDARDAAAVRPTLLPVACAYAPVAAGGHSAAENVQQAVRPEWLAPGAVRPDYLAAQLYHACRGVLAAPAHPSRRYTAYPGVYLQQPAATPAVAAGRGRATAAEDSAQTILHTPESEVTVQFGNNGLNR